MINVSQRLKQKTKEPNICAEFTRPAPRQDRQTRMGTERNEDRKG